MCERVTTLLGDLRERYSLEVSSPGQRAPADQARALPPLRRQPRARAHAPSARDRPAHRAAAARAVRSFTGELVGASEEEVTLAADGGVIAIPYSEIRRSNLIEE